MPLPKIVTNGYTITHMMQKFCISEKYLYGFNIVCSGFFRYIQERFWRFGDKYANHRMSLTHSELAREYITGLSDVQPWVLFGGSVSGCIDRGLPILPSRDSWHSPFMRILLIVNDQIPGGLTWLTFTYANDLIHMKIYSIW